MGKDKRVLLGWQVTNRARGFIYNCDPRRFHSRAALGQTNTARSHLESQLRPHGETLAENHECHCAGSAVSCLLLSPTDSHKALPLVTPRVGDDARAAGPWVDPKPLMDSCFASVFGA